MNLKCFDAYSEVQSLLLQPLHFDVYFIGLLYVHSVYPYIK